MTIRANTPAPKLPSTPAPMPKPQSELDHDLSQPLDLPDQPAPSKPAVPVASHKSARLVYVIVGAVVVLGLAGLGWKLMSHHHPDQTAQPSAATTSPSSSSDKTSDIPAATQTKDFENGPLGLQLKYPSTWTATNTSDIGVRVTSPDFSYETTNKGTLTGNFRIYIRKGARPQDSKYIGRGVAIKDSEKLVYSSPAPGQRTDTLLSAFGLDTDDNFAYFMIAGNFNLKKGDTLGPNYGKEAETFIISGGYSAKDLTDDMATNTVPTDDYANTTAYKQAIDIIKSIKLL